MNWLKGLLGAAAVGTIVLAFRDGDRGAWLRPALPGEAEYGGDTLVEDEGRVDDEEPVLGYDGMDRDTLMDWLRAADLDTGTLRNVRLYEATHQNRAVVLDTVDALIG